MSKLPHEERTASDPREHQIHSVVLQSVENVNPDVRLIKLRPAHGQPVKFLPGQWVDLFIPGLRNAGGFTITSTPRDASGPQGTVELAIQRSPNNPSAAWLWQDVPIIMNRPLHIRVGGNFVWPPHDPSSIHKAVFVAGGVGINPLISILAHVHQTASTSMPNQLQFLYSTRRQQSEDDILFLPRLRSIFEDIGSPSRQLRLFQTQDVNSTESVETPSVQKNIFSEYRRMTETDLAAAVGSPEDAAYTTAFVCGPPSMTDWAVAQLRGVRGINPDRVLCEKWW